MTAWTQVLDDIVRTRREALVGYAYLLCGDVSEAEDLVQDALARTFSRGRRARNPQLAEASVRRLVARASLRRSGPRKPGARPAPGVGDASQALGAGDARVPVSAPVSRWAEVQRALDDLPPRERTCLVLRYFMAQPVDAIADELSLSVAAVTRALDSSRDLLAGRLGTIEDPGDSLPVAPKGGDR